MQKYMRQDIFNDIHSMMYIERKTAYNRLRKGIITCIDLEKYDWRHSSKSEIRSTEATVVERLPPRIKIREGAVIELPHIMLLVNDRDNVFIEKIGADIHKAGNKPLYDFNLMMDSGNIADWIVPQDFSDYIVKALETVYNNNTSADGTTLMFAVGDGNHSLAATKSVWETVKKNTGAQIGDDSSNSLYKNAEHNPLRYALVEIVNIYDEGLTFEPIHRVLFDTDCKTLLDFIQNALGGTVEKVANRAELQNKVENSTAVFGFVSKTEGFRYLETKLDCFAISALQPVLDDFINTHTVKIDYIHGTDEAFRLAETENAVSIVCPPIAKESFFLQLPNTVHYLERVFRWVKQAKKDFILNAENFYNNLKK